MASNFDSSETVSPPAPPSPKWLAFFAAQAHEAVSEVPFIPRRMFDEVKAGYERHGIVAVFLGPLSEIPYKIYAIEAPGRFGLVEFVAATAPARAWRFILVCLFSAGAAHLLRRTWRKTLKQLALIHAIAWILFYSFYWGRIALNQLS